MNTDKIYSNVIKGIRKCVKHCNYYDKKKLFKYITNVPLGDEQNIYVCDEDGFYANTRESMYVTLRSINYRRMDQEWTPYTTIAFLHKVFELNSYDKNSIPYIELSNIISDMFNVKPGRIMSTALLFIYNMQNKPYTSINMILRRYISTFDIVMFKYSDMDKLHKCIEDRKIRDEELNIIKKYYNVI